MVLMMWCAKVAETTTGYSMSEDLKGAIVGAVLAFLLTGLANFFSNIIGKVIVIKTRSSTQIKRSASGAIEQIDVYANILCENHKREMASIYAWKAILYTSCGVYKVEMSNMCADSEYKFLDVITLNRYQSAQCFLKGTIDLNRISAFRKYDDNFMGYKDIEKVTKIEKVEIQYQTSRSKNVLIAENGD